jgi:hypothetical protein
LVDANCKRYGISAPTEVPYFLEIEPEVYFTQGRVEISRMSFTAISRNQMKKKDYSYVGLMLQVEVRVPVLLKVKSYTRVRFGKTEKVSAYYRRIGVRK